MGFLKNLKAGIEAVQAAQKEASSVQDSFVPLFVNPKPQAEVDAAWQGTGPVRAIVFASQHQVLEPGERVGAMTVKVTLRPRGPGETLGEKVTLKATLSSMEASLLDEGLDIPVERDPATGALTKVDSKLLKQELAHLKEEGARRNPGWAWDEDVQGMIEVGQTIGQALTGGKPKAAPVVTESMSDPRRQPIDRITWEKWVAVRAHLQVNPAPYGVEHETLKFGIQRFTWPAIDNAWNSRVAGDPELKALFDRDLAAGVDQIS